MRPTCSLPAFVVLCTLLTACDVDARCDVRAAYYAIRSPADPGSATVLLRNNGKQPLLIDRLLMDGTPLPCAGIGEGLRPAAAARSDPARQLAAARIVWARLEPNPIPPARSAHLYVQFRHRPPSAFRLRLLRGGTPVAECRVFPVRNRTRILNIAFRQDLSKCYIYVANASSTRERICRVELNDVDVTERAWMSVKEIGQQTKALIVVPRPGVRLGECATVLVGFASGRRAVGWVRALPVFPVALEHGGADPALGITATEAHWPAPSSTTPPPSLGSSVSAVRIFHCPSHLMGPDWRACAAEILRRRAVLIRSNPGAPAYTAVCRARSELASPVFAHTTDAGFLNPYLPKYSRLDPPHPLDAVANAMRLARRANAPAPCFALVAGHTFSDEKRPSSPEELRRLAYAVVACGARGVLYRIRRGQLTPQNAATLKRLNDKLRQLRPLLLIAEPMDWASSSNERVKARVLLAGTHGLLLFLLNAGDTKGRLRPTGSAEITVRLPQWLGRLRLAPESDPLDGSAAIAKERIRVEVSQVPSALVLVWRNGG